MLRPSLILLTTLCSQLAMAVSWNEATDGEISGEFGAPSVFAASLGDNFVGGVIGDANRDNFDIFTFEVAPNLVLNQIQLVNYGADPSYPSDYSSFDLFPGDVTSNGGGQVARSRVSAGPNGGVMHGDLVAAFNTMLSSSLDSYFVLAETRPNVNYQFNFIFDYEPGYVPGPGQGPSPVPLPASGWLFITAMAALVGRKRWSSPGAA